MSKSRSAACFSMVLVSVMLVSPDARAGYWKRIGTGEITQPVAAWQEGGVSFKVHSVSRNNLEATFAGNGIASHATMRWSDPSEILREEELAPVSGEVANELINGGYGSATLQLVFDEPGLSWFAVTGGKIRLLTLGGTSAKQQSDVPMPKGGSGKRTLYYRAGFGERATLQVSYAYEYVPAKP